METTMSKTKKPHAYIASPYTRGDPAINTHFQCRVFDELMDAGLVLPVVPLWSHFQHLMFPRPSQDWIDYDLALLERCDALLRLNAEHAGLDYLQSESSGADAEVAAALDKGLPLFGTVAALHQWARERSQPTESAGHAVEKTAKRLYEFIREITCTTVVAAESEEKAVDAIKEWDGDYWLAHSTHSPPATFVECVDVSEPKSQTSIGLREEADLIIW